MINREKRKKCIGVYTRVIQISIALCLLGRWWPRSLQEILAACLTFSFSFLPFCNHPSIIVQSSRNRQLNAWLSVKQHNTDRQVFIQTLALTRTLCLPLQKGSWFAALLPPSWESFFLSTHPHDTLQRSRVSPNLN